MQRNLDLTALRSFVAVAELGAVTSAASKGWTPSLAGVWHLLIYA